MPRLALHVLAWGLVLVALVVALAYVLQRRLVFLPEPGPVVPAASMLPGGRDVAFTTADGLRLSAWYVPGGAGGMTVLVAGGNAGNRAGRAPLAMALHGRGMSVLLMDYRGYGGNPGTPTEDGLALDVRAARDYLVGERGVPEDRLLYFGESLGAAVVTRLAAENPPAGLVLRSPFRDLASVAREHYPALPVRVLLKDRFPVEDTIRRVRVPTVVVYGDADDVVPPAQSREVAGAAAGPVRTVRVPGAGHNDRVLLDGPQLVDAVADLAR